MSEDSADAAERALIDWKYYDDPRPGHGKGPLSIEKERFEAAMAELRSRDRSLPLEDFIAERNQLSNEYGNRLDDFHQQRHAELGDVRSRIRNAQRRLKRRVLRELK